VTVGCRPIELDGGGEIRLRDDGHIGRVENRRVLERLVFTFRHRATLGKGET
jgi:hypothetical protein